MLNYDKSYHFVASAGDCLVRRQVVQACQQTTCIRCPGNDWNIPAVQTRSNGGFLKWRIPIMDCFMENPIVLINGWWLGVPTFMEPPKCLVRNLQASETNVSNATVFGYIQLTKPFGYLKSINIAKASGSQLLEFRTAPHFIGNIWWFPEIASHHPFLDWIFPNKNHPAIGVPLWMRP